MCIVYIVVYKSAICIYYFIDTVSNFFLSHETLHKNAEYLRVLQPFAKKNNVGKVIDIFFVEITNF